MLSDEINSLCSQTGKQPHLWQIIPDIKRHAGMRSDELICIAHTQSLDLKFSTIVVNQSARWT